MAADPALGVRLQQRRLAEKEVGVARERDERIGRATVGGVRERRPVRRHAEAEGEHVVVENTVRNDALSGHLERWCRPRTRAARRCPRTSSAARSRRRSGRAWRDQPGGSQSSGCGLPLAGPNWSPQAHGTRSPQWSRWKCEITIASTVGQPSAARRRGRTPGPQSSSRRPPPLSTRYPDCAPPGFGHAGEQPATVSFTGE